MTAVILDGKHVAQLTEEQLSKRVETLKEKSDGRTPVLATILVGDDPASATYVKMKGNACRRVGMESMAIELPASTRTNDLLKEIEQLNHNQDVHGILLQHPVPSQIDERACFDMIALEKDVDGVTCLGLVAWRWASRPTAVPRPKASCAYWHTTRSIWKACTLW